MSAATQQAPARNGTGPTPPVLRIAGLSKTFGATRALIDASLDIRPGEIHALVGQNGSGKSTLIKTLAGYHTPDAGSEAEIDGAPFGLGHAVPDGLRFVHQDLGLVLELNAMDNLALHGGFARGAIGRVRWSEQERETHRVLARFGVDLDIHRPLAAATPVERTVVAIAAALQGWQGGSGVLVLDEPTAVLPHDEVERLFAMVREVRERGHERALRLAPPRRDLRARRPRDRAARRPRDRHPCRSPTSTPPELASLMVGEEVDPDYRAPVAARPDAPVVLEARDVHGRWLRGVDLDVHRGEILGIAGLAGRGRARAAVRARRLRAARRQRPHPPARAVAPSGATSPTPGTSTSRSSPPTAGVRGSSRSSPSARTCRCPCSGASAGADGSTSAPRRSSSSSGRSASASSRPAPTRRSRRSAAATSRRSSWRAASCATPRCSSSASRPRASTSGRASPSTT